MTTPNQAQIQLLQQRPELASEFDAKFGAGASAHYLTPITTPDTVSEDSEEGARDLGDYIVDAAKGGVAGFVKGAENAGDLVAQGADAIGLPAGVRVDENGIELVSLEEMNAEGGDVAFGQTGEDDSFAPETETMAGAITEGVSQFMTGFVPGLSALKGAKVLQGAGLGAAAMRGAVAGAASDFTVFDAQEARLSNLVQEYPALQNPVTEYLAANEDDGEVEGRVKQVLEGLMAGSVVEGLMYGLRHIRKARKAAETGGKKAANEVIEEASQELAEESPRPVAQVDPQAPKAAPAPKLKVDTAKLAESFSKNTGAEFVGTSDAFNWSNINVEQDAAAVIEETAEALKQSGDWRKGQTFEEITAREAAILADTMGGKSEGLMSWVHREAAEAESRAAKMKAVRTLQASLANKISDVGHKIASGMGTDFDQVEMLRLAEQHAQLTNSLGAARASHARSTAAHRIPVQADLTPEQVKTILDNNGNTKKLAEVLSMARGNPKQVAKALEVSALTRGIHVHNEFWINALLSRPSTHAINTLSNASQVVLMPAERALGAVFRGDLGAARDALRFYSSLHSVFFDAIHMAAKSGWNEEAYLDPMIHKVDLGFERAISHSGDGMLAAGINWFGKAVRLPSRFLGTSDEFFKQLNYRADVKSRSIAEGMNKGLKGDALNQYVARRFEQSFDEVGRAIDGESLRVARDATFTSELHGFSKSLQSFLNRHPTLKLIAPFVRTPINILGRAFQYTPVLARLSARNREIMREGGRAAQELRGRQSAGLVLFSSAVMMAAEGKLTGSGPANASERKIMYEAGWRPYSVVTTDENGKKVYTSFQRLDPYAAVLGVVADLSEISPHVEGTDALLEASSAVVVALSQNIASKSYLRGFSEFLDVINADESTMWKVEKFLKTRAASYVGGVKEQTQLLGLSEDPVMREVRSLVETIQARVPWWANDLAPRKSWLTGEVVRKDDSFVLPQDLAVARVAHQTGNDTIQKMADLGYGFSPPSRFVDGIELNSQQYSRLSELTAKPSPRSPKLIDAIQKALDHPKLKDLPPLPEEYSELASEDPRVVAVRRIISRYKSAARRALVQEDDALHEEIVAQRTQEGQVRGGVIHEAPASGSNPEQDSLMEFLNSVN